MSAIFNAHVRGQQPIVRVGIRPLVWASAFAWSRQRLGDQVVWHLHARSDRQIHAIDVALSIYVPRFVAAQRLRYLRNARAQLVRGLKQRGEW